MVVFVFFAFPKWRGDTDCMLHPPPLLPIPTHSSPFFSRLLNLLPRNASFSLFLSSFRSCVPSLHLHTLPSAHIHSIGRLSSLCRRGTSLHCRCFIPTLRLPFHPYTLPLPLRPLSSCTHSSILFLHGTTTSNPFAESMTEVYGEFRTGKTQMAQTLCVMAQLPRDMGGCEGKVCFFASPSLLSPKRKLVLD